MVEQVKVGNRKISIGLPPNQSDCNVLSRIHKVRHSLAFPVVFRYVFLEILFVVRGHTARR